MTKNELTVAASEAPEPVERLCTTQESRDEWCKQRGSGMTSAVGEYTPDEFWDLLDDVETLLLRTVDQSARIAELEGLLRDASQDLDDCTSDDGPKPFELKRARKTLERIRSALEKP